MFNPDIQLQSCLGPGPIPVSGENRSLHLIDLPTPILSVGLLPGVGGGLYQTMEEFSGCKLPPFNNQMVHPCHLKVVIPLIKSISGSWRTDAASPLLPRLLGKYVLQNTGCSFWSSKSTTEEEPPGEEEKAVVQMCMMCVKAWMMIKCNYRSSTWPATRGGHKINGTSLRMEQKHWFSR